MSAFEAASSMVWESSRVPCRTLVSGWASVRVEPREAERTRHVVVAAQEGWVLSSRWRKSPPT